MGETLNWSPGLLYQEEKNFSAEFAFFRFPSRIYALGGFVVTALCLGALAVLREVEDWGGVLIFGGPFTLFAALVGILGIWQQRLIRIHRATREITFVLRHPFRTRSEVVLADHLRDVRISDEGDPDIRDPERQFRVHLVRMNGDRIFLGKGQPEEAINLGRRLSELLKIPLEILPSDNLRRE
jgi:hypothetical protein